jgi:ligand-binding SRPBCC domain-containing protein
MDFRILSEVPEDMYDGLLVKYRVRIPLIGSQTWLSEIKHVRELRSFVDEQRIGPHKLWYHYHEIRQVDDGVLFTDLVTYDVPFKPFGLIAHALFIRGTLDRIFDHRNVRFRELLENSDVSKGA